MALGRFDAAAAEYGAALRMEPDWRAGRLGLARANLAAGRFAAAIDDALRGASAAPDADAAAPFHAVAAAASEAGGDLAAATRLWHVTCEADRVEVDWAIRAAQTLRVTGDPHGACQLLAGVRQRNPSVVLALLHAETMLDGGDTDGAATLIERHTIAGRVQPSWRLLDARVALARGETDAARRCVGDVLRALGDETPHAANPLRDAQRREARRLLASINRRILWPGGG